MSDWVSWFLEQRPVGSFYVKIDRDFLLKEAENDEIKKKVKHWKNAFCLVSGNITEQNKYHKDAVQLYGLVHQKFLLTEEGRLRMIEKWRKREFPVCPRLLCKKCTCFPIGIPEEQSCCMFCPKCTDIYKIPGIVDGGHFGMEWVHFLMQSHPEIVEGMTTSVYEPKVFGFTVQVEDVPDST